MSDDIHDSVESLENEFEVQAPFNNGNNYIERVKIQLTWLMFGLGFSFGLSFPKENIIMALKGESFMVLSTQSVLIFLLSVLLGYCFLTYANDNTIISWKQLSIIFCIGFFIGFEIFIDFLLLDIAVSKHKCYKYQTGC